MSKNIYYENNKEKIKEYNKKRVLCTCGLEISKGNKSGHKKSIKHLSILNL